MKGTITALALGSMLAIAACKDMNVDPVVTTKVRFVSVSAGTPSFDVLSGTSVLATSVAFGSATECLDVPTGAGTIALRQNGTTTNLLTLTPTLTAGTNYLVVVSGGTAAGALRATNFPENATAAGAGRARLQIVNAASGLGGQDVFVTAPGALFGTPNFSNLVYTASTAYLDVPNGSQQVRVTNTGSTITLNATSPTQTLTSAQPVTLILATSAAGGGPFQFFAITPCS